MDLLNEEEPLDDGMDDGGPAPSPRVPRGGFDEVDPTASLNRSDVEHLPAAPGVGGYGIRGDIFGASASQPVGRASSPKLYGSAALHVQCTQLRVWKVENGVPTALGVIDASASEEDFVQHFVSAMPKAGEGKCIFKLRPIDINGNELGQEVTSIISEHHAALRRIREAASAAQAAPAAFPFMGSGSGSGIPAGAWDMMQRMMDMQAAQASMLQKAADEERERARRIQEDTARERVELASNAASGVQSLTERMMQDESRRNDASNRMQNEQGQMLLTTLTSIFTQQMNMQSAHAEQARLAMETRLEQERLRAEREFRESEVRRQREVEEIERRLRHEREESERKSQRERQEAEQKIARERSDMEARMERERMEAERKERKEKEDFERREREREGERARQHDLRMKEMEIQRERDREHSERMFELRKSALDIQNGSGLKGTLEQGVGMLKMLGVEPQDVIGRLLGRNDDEEEEDPGPAQPSPWVAALPAILGTVAEVVKAGANKTPPMRPQLAPPGYYPGAPMLPPPGGFPGQVIPPEPPPGTVVPQAAAPAEPEAPPIDLPLNVQKKARVAIRDLVKKYRNNPEESWSDLTVQALGNELSIFHYCQAVSVRTALKEASAEEAMTDRVITLLQANPMVPSDLNFG
jgi:hypothetical protein